MLKYEVNFVFKNNVSKKKATFSKSRGIDTASNQLNSMLMYLENQPADDQPIPTTCSSAKSSTTSMATSTETSTAAKTTETSSTMSMATSMATAAATTSKAAATTTDVCSATKEQMSSSSTHRNQPVGAINSKL